MKQNPFDLAYLGATPAFNEKLYVGRPNIGNREDLSERINSMLDRRWLSNSGPYVEDFQRRIADFVGVKHCIAICNATVALEIAIRAMGLTGEVIIPSFTFVATAHALQWQQITPVFCDIDPETHTLDPEMVEAMITPRTTGIIGVHLWGRPCNTKALKTIARKHNLGLLYDAAHAFGCSHEGTMVGNFGDAEVFSFHATKFLNSFEGGAIVTNNDDLAERMRLMQNFGFAGYDNVVHIGTNGKMTEISAAMGLTSIESIDDFIETNRRNYHHYREEIADIPGLSLISYNEAEKNNFQYIVLEVDEDLTGLSRDVLLDVLWAENVVARRYFFPGCHRMEPYRSYFPHAGLLLNETEALSNRVLLLPNGTAVNSSDISLICDIIRTAIDNSSLMNAEAAQRLNGETVEVQTGTE